jgi:hypothetical protein
MPHAAAQFVAGVRQRREPDETAADIEAEVDAARVIYANEMATVYEQYQILTNTTPIDPDPPGSPDETTEPEPKPKPKPKPPKKPKKSDDE